MRKALELQSIGKIIIIDGRKFKHKSQKKDIPEDFGMPKIFGPGWAIRAKRGKMYGKQYISKYMDTIKELFDEGVADSMEKNGPGLVLEILQQRYPEKLTYQLKLKSDRKLVGLLKNEN